MEPQTVEAVSSGIKEVTQNPLALTLLSTAGGLVAGIVFGLIEGRIRQKTHIKHLENNLTTPTAVQEHSFLNLIRASGIVIAMGVVSLISESFAPFAFGVGWAGVTSLVDAYFHENAGKYYDGDV